jgi:hypothetical protein
VENGEDGKGKTEGKREEYIYSKYIIQILYNIIILYNICYYALHNQNHQNVRSQKSERQD